jgi:hypothetical protein
MKETSKLFRVMACVAVLAGSVVLAEAAQVGKAVVRRVVGAAEASEGGAWKALKGGEQLAPGTVIRTANDSSVDLFLDQNGPLVRLVENTTLGLEKLNFENTGVDTVIETQLDLKSGRIVGSVKKLSATSKYEIKTPNGVAGIRGTEYVISADGTIKVTKGQIVAVYVKADGGVVTQVVNAGEKFNPATQKVEPMTTEEQGEAEALATSLKGGSRTQDADVETPPVVFVSPVVGGTQ